MNLDTSKLYSANAEKQVLATMLLAPDSINDVANAVTPDDFFVPAHKELFRVILWMSDQGKPIEPFLVHEKLVKDGLAEVVGSPGIIGELGSLFTSALTVMQYAEIITDKSTLRALLKTSDSITQSIKDEQDPNDILKDVEQAIFSISQIRQTSQILDATACVRLFEKERESIQAGNQTNRLATGIGSLDLLNGGLPKPGFVVVAAEPGCGKCQAPETPILMFSGEIKRADEIIVGDQLMGPDSKPRIVASTCAGTNTMFEIRPVKGDKIRVNGEHIISMKMSGARHKNRRFIDMSINEYLKQNKTFKQKAKLFKVGVEFDEIKNDISPYWVGLWLGDGSVGKTDITKDEPELNEFFKTIPCSKKKGYSARCSSHVFTGVKGVKNTYLDLAKECVIDKEKRIPKRYLINSRENRLELLAGLLDTDGYLYNNCFEIITKYNGLKDDLIFLARSLGLCANYSCKKGTIKSTGFVGFYWRITISGETSSIPCKIKRKTAGKRAQIKNALVTGFDVVQIDDGKYVGWELEGEDKHYLWGDFTVTHNSALAMNFLEQWCREGRAVGVFSLEMTIQQLIKRSVASISEVNSKRLNSILVPDEEAKVAKANREIERWKFWIDPTPNLTPTMLRTKARMLKKKGCQALIIDYLQLMKGSDRRDERREQVAEVTRTAKLIANETGMTLVFLAQVNREGRKSGELTLAHLKESSTIEEDADAVLLLQLLVAKEGQPPFPENHETIIGRWAKYRDGSTGVFEMGFNKPHLKFSTRVATPTRR